VGSVLELRALDGRRVWRRDLVSTGRLTPFGDPRFARDGRTVYLEGSRDGRRGIWAVPVPVGKARVVVAYDDPVLVALPWMSVGPDRLYLTVGQYESDIRVARLKW
jgi:hypothetical protein